MKTLFLLLALLLPVTAGAESLMTFRLDQPVRLEAETMEGNYASERFEALGAARLFQENLTLHADSIWFNKHTNEAGAKGNVTLVEKSGTLLGDDLLLNFTSGQARLLHARAHLSEQGFNLSGESIERFDESHYRLNKGSFTACSASPPAWKFGASQVDVEVGGYARARNMIFYLREVPVFYLPYFFYPVKTERESGLLIPHFGLSQLRGAETYLAYYQVLGRNRDATFYLDTYSRAGIGTGAEYRYFAGEENSGETFLYYVSGFQGRRDVYAGHWLHNGILPGEITLRSDLEYISDRSYLQDFAIDAKDYNRELVESYLSLSRAWGKTDLSAQGEYVNNLSTTTKDYPISRLPSAHLAILPQRIAETPLYLRLDLQGNHIQRGSETVGQTLLTRPAARLALSPFTGVSLDLEAGYRAMLTRTPADSAHIGFYDFTSRLGTLLQRTYGGTQGKTSLRHDIEPEISYLHIADGHQSTFTELVPENAFLPTDRITFSLSNRLSSRARNAEGVISRQQPLWHRISSGYSLGSDATRPKSLLPMRNEIALQVSDRITLHGDTFYGLEAGERRWQSAMSGITLKDRRHDEVTIDYYYRDEDIANYLSGRLQLPLTAQSTLTYEARYAVDLHDFLEHRTDLEYRGECWSVILTYRDRPGNQEYLVNFNLAGLSTQGLR